MILKKGVSPVIATVLLLVLTIVAVSILAAFVVPFVNNSLKNSKECFNELANIRFDDKTGYNCHATNALEEKRTGFSVRIDGTEIVGFQVTLFSQGIANSYRIEKDAKSSLIRMLDKNFETELEVPDRGGLRTYVADGEYVLIDANPLLRNGALCDTGETIEIDSCLDQNVIDKLFFD